MASITPTTPLTSPILDICSSPNTPFCALSHTTFGEVFGRLLQFIFTISIFLTLGYLLYGGIKWITSGGDKDKVGSARSMLIASVVGLLVVFLSFFILNFVLQFLVGTTFDQLRLPTLARTE